MKYLSLLDGDNSLILYSKQGLLAILANNRVTKILLTSWNQVIDEGYVFQKQMDFYSYLVEVKGPSLRVVTLIKEEDKESIFNIITVEADKDITIEDGDFKSSHLHPRTSNQTKTRYSKRFQKDANTVEAEELSNKPVEPAKLLALVFLLQKGKSKALATASKKEPTWIRPPTISTDSKIEKDITKELIRKITKKVLNAKVKVLIASLAQFNPQIAFIILVQLRNIVENVTKIVQIEGDKIALLSNA